MFLSGSIQCTVPSVKDILSEIFRLVEVFFVSSQMIRFQELPHKPLLVIIYIQDAADVSSSGSTGTIDSVHRPFPGLGI